MFEVPSRPDRARPDRLGALSVGPMFPRSELCEAESGRPPPGASAPCLPNPLLRVPPVRLAKQTPYPIDRVRPNDVLSPRAKVGRRRRAGGRSAPHLGAPAWAGGRGDCPGEARPASSAARPPDRLALQGGRSRNPAGRWRGRARERESRARRRRVGPIVSGGGSCASRPGLRRPQPPPPNPTDPPPFASATRISPCWVRLMPRISKGMRPIGWRSRPPALRPIGFELAAPSQDWSRSAPHLVDTRPGENIGQAWSTSAKIGRCWANIGRAWSTSVSWCERGET